ncbi:MAG: family 16 glycosylhydrolase [Phycisphaerales bacterium]|nr:MAG: family 16 glycosylhydrolase [Phycisphaerales bacterium]
MNRMIHQPWAAIALAAILLSWGFSPSLQAAVNEWTSIGPEPVTSGPFTGRVSALVTSPTNPNRFYAGGASGGVWRTLDGGFTWQPLTDHLPACAIGALAMDPFDEDTIYAGTGEANFANHCLYGLGIYKTTDGGETWRILAGETFGGRTFSRLVVSYVDSQVLYASIMQAGGFPARNAAKGHPGENGPLGVFRSTDGGETWEHLLNGLPPVAASDVWMHPTDPNILFAAIGDIFGHPDNGIYRSMDGGDSWTKLTEGLPTVPVGRITLAIAPSLPDLMYAIITEPSDESGGGAELLFVYRSQNGGDFWQARNTGNFQATYGWYLSVAIVHPTNPNIAFVGGVTMLRTTDGGGIWQDVTPPHVDMHAFAYDAVGALICGNDGGIHYTTNHGDTWFARNDTINVIQFYPGISLHPTNPIFVLGGTQDNGTNRRDSALAWSHRLGGDGGHTALHPETPNTMFAELQGTGNLYRSTNGGNSFSLSSNGIYGLDRNCFLPPIVYDPTNKDRLLYGTHRIYESLNRGQSWTAISGDLTGGAPAAIRSIAIAPSNPQTVYAATNDHRILVSMDGGQTWEVKLTDATGWPRTTREIAIDPLDDSIVYLGGARFGVDQIRKTTDWGDTWVTLDGDLPDVPVNAVAVDRTDAGRTILLGTDTGVFFSFNEGQSWDKVGTNLPNVPANDIRIDPNFDRVVIATLGRGAWEIDLPRPDRLPEPILDEFNYAFAPEQRDNSTWAKSSACWDFDDNEVCPGIDEGVQFEPQYVSTQEPQDENDGVLAITVPAGECKGGRIDTLRADLHFGRYRAKIKTADVAGVVNSFFNYRGEVSEIVIHFATDDLQAPPCSVQFGTRVDEATDQLAEIIDCFPSEDYHVYGFDWYEDHVDFMVDEMVIATITDPVPPHRSAVSLANWTCDSTWGQGPPASDATMLVDWVFYSPFETRAPRVNGHSYEDEPDPTITVRFDEFMHPEMFDTSTLSVVGSVSGLVDWEGAFDPFTKTFTLRPTMPILAGEDVTVTATSSLQDLAGNGLAEAHTFGFTVCSDSTPPTLQGVPDVDVVENSSYVHAVDLWAYAADPDTPASALMFAIEGDPDPNCGVIIDANRYIDAVPAPDWFGTCQITVSVSDGCDGWDTDIFTLTVVDEVTASGLPSQVTPLDQTVGSEDGTATFNVHIADGQQTPWTSQITGGADWLSISSGLSGEGDGTVEAAYEVNAGPGQRIGAIRVTAPGETGSPWDVTVTQVIPVAGFIQLTLTPQEAADAGIQWRVDDGPWHQSGEVELDIPPGSHAIDYLAVAGWLAPEEDSVLIDGRGLFVTRAMSRDCNNNGIADEFEPQDDCNDNGVQDICDLAEGTSADCNENAVPDECDIADGTSEDCTGNGTPDECEPDCNENGSADSCDIADGNSFDWNENGVPDECECTGLECCNFLTSNPPVCLGDANGDGQVTPTDVGLIKFFYGQTDLESLCRYDIQCDGTIKPADIGLTKLYYGDCEGKPDPCWR